MSDRKHGGKFQAYVCGFVFSSDFKTVLLIRKNRPDWQAGRLNGIGGHVEDIDHNTAHAISRECEEETGVFIPPSQWTLVVRTHFPLAQVDFFSVVWPSTSLREFKTITDEALLVEDVAELSETVLPNLNWLIPLCIYRNSSFGGTSISDVIHVHEN